MAFIFVCVSCLFFFPLFGALRACPDLYTVLGLNCNIFWFTITAVLDKTALRRTCHHHTLVTHYDIMPVERLPSGPAPILQTCLGEPPFATLLVAQPGVAHTTLLTKNFQKPPSSTNMLNWVTRGVQQSCVSCLLSFVLGCEIRSSQPRQTDLHPD